MKMYQERSKRQQCC